MQTLVPQILSVLLSQRFIVEWIAFYQKHVLTHLAPDQLLPFHYEIPCEGK